MCIMKNVRAFAVAVIAVVACSTALAQESPVTIVRNDGTEVAGTLLDFGRRTSSRWYSARLGPA
jgi:hypothetical protein